jgi:putative oxidoreductase
MKGSMKSMMLLGRLLIGVLFVVSGARKILSWPGAIGYMQGAGFPTMEIAGYPLVQILLVATIALEILGGLMVAFGIGEKPAAVILALFTLAAAAMFHSFWTITDAAQYSNQLNHFLKNVAIAGGLLVVAARSHADDHA